MDKKAKVIWLKETSVNQYVDFRCDFYVKETQNVFLNISVDPRYAVYVNGNFVPAFQYADYKEYMVYDSIDISEYVTVSENTLGIVGYYDGVNSAVYRKGNAGIIFAVTCKDEILCQSSEKTLCRQSLDFVSGPVERITEQLSFSFRQEFLLQFPHFRFALYRLLKSMLNILVIRNFLLSGVLDSAAVI